MMHLFFFFTSVHVCFGVKKKKNRCEKKMNMHQCINTLGNMLQSEINRVKRSVAFKARRFSDTKVALATSPL